MLALVALFLCGSIPTTPVGAASVKELYSAVDGAGLQKLDPAQAPLSTALGVLGMPGFTAYAGLLLLGSCWLLTTSRAAVFLGRHVGYPVALEGESFVDRPGVLVRALAD